VPAGVGRWGRGKQMPGEIREKKEENLGSYKPQVFPPQELTKRSWESRNSQRDHFLLKNSLRDLGNLGTHKEIILLS